MKIRKLSLLLSIIFMSCGGGSIDVPYYDDSDLEDIPNLGEISVPYTESNGVKYIRVTLNGIGVDMIFDTGCSGTQISLAEAQYLFSKGLLTEEDILGMSESKVADGSIVPNMIVNLKEIVIGDEIYCRNVTATVSLNDSAPLLLGNEVLDGVASYTIDNENDVIKFKIENE